MARRRDPLAAARARLLALQRQHAAGALDDARYDAERRAIEREIGERLLAPEGAASLPAVAEAAPARPSWRLVAGLAVAVLAVAGLGYWKTGAPSLPRADMEANGAAAMGPETPSAGASGATAMEQIATMVDRLAARMKEQPNDAEGWTMLARSYTVLSRFADALPAYRRAVELQPKNAGLLADYADAVAATHRTVNNPESIALIDRALALEPEHPKALALAGTVAYDRGDFRTAIADWQRIIERLPAESELRPQVQASIEEARTRLGGAPPQMANGPAPSSPAAPAAATPATTVAVASAAASAKPMAAGRSISGVVTLDPALAARAASADSVFVFARAAQGSRMPLAVRRATVADLPLTFTLDDSMAMAPGMTISSVPTLIVGARISKSGNAIGQAGDLEGEVGPVEAGGGNLRITIGQVRR